MDWLLLTRQKIEKWRSCLVDKQLRWIYQPIYVVSTSTVKKKCCHWILLNVSYRIVCLSTDNFILEIVFSCFNKIGQSTANIFQKDNHENLSIVSKTLGCCGSWINSAISKESTNDCVSQTIARFHQLYHLFDNIANFHWIWSQVTWRIRRCILYVRIFGHNYLSFCNSSLENEQPLWIDGRLWKPHQTA